MGAGSLKSASGPDDGKKEADGRAGKREKVKNRFKKHIKLVGNVVSALSILFMAVALARLDFHKISVKNGPAFLAACAAGVVLKTFTVCLSAGAWRRWLEFFAGKRCSRREAISVYARANIGKYLPGNVMHYVERNLFAGKLQLSQKQTAAASILEVLSLILAALTASGLLAFSNLKEALRMTVKEHAFFHRLSDSGFGLPLFMILVVLALAAVLGVLFYTDRRIGRLRRFVKTFLSCFFTYAAVLFLLGMIFVLLYWYWAGRPDLSKALWMTASYITAWVLGFIIPGAPGGIGVREMVLMFLLVPAAGRDLTAALSVVHRLITVAGDFAAYVIVYAIGAACAAPGRK